MKLFKTQFAKVKEWWKPERGTVSILGLTTAKLQVKLSTGLIFISSRVEKAMSKIQWEASATRSLAKATIALRNIEKIKPVEFEWKGATPNIGVLAQTVASWSAYNIPPGLNGPAGPTGAVGSQYTATFIPNNNITFNSQTNKAILTITGEGDVIWNGKPSEAADILVQSFQLAVENKKGVTKAARRRYYWKAIDNLAKKSNQMSAEEFVDFVRKQAYNRECKVLIDTLKGEVNAT